MSNPTRLDEDEQRELEELRDRYRREQTGEAVPGAGIDRSIREAAHREAKRRWLFTPFPHNWMVPVSVVALLLITVSIVHFMPDEPGPGEIVITEDQAPATRAPKPAEPRALAPSNGPEEARAPRERASESAGRVQGIKPMLQDRKAEPGRDEQVSAVPAPARTEPEAIPALDEWARRIEALLEANRDEEAEREMRALLERYPEATFENEALRTLAQRVRSEELSGQ